MSHFQIRQKFLDFFKKRGHTIVPSSSLIPDDPSVLLTSAGMQQFKPYFLGQADPQKDFGSQRTASIQKCFRTSDIEEVGDESHLTFFEMLGNFSFGPVGKDNPDDFGQKGYFKRAAIHWAWQFLNSILDLSQIDFFVTVFKGDKEVPFDKEAYLIWKEEIGLPEEKIKRFGREDNFWGPTGPSGPCGPTTEIHLKGIEVWNLVFNEYYKDPDGHLEKLNSPGVDTGMGLERLAMILQKKENIFQTDLFVNLITYLEKETPQLDVRTKRIFADHSRGIVFLISDGVIPSNKEAGYVLRRLIRRLVAYQRIHQLKENLLENLAEIIIQDYAQVYPELKDNSQRIKEEIIQEREKFSRALKGGIKHLNRLDKITAKEAFYLYETYGLPFELILELAPKKTKFLKREDFEAEFRKHQVISRAGREKKFGGHGLGEARVFSPEDEEKIKKLHTATHLLHQALREILGPHVRQMGSDINPERLRFDFSHPQKLTPKEIRKIEERVNQKIKENLPVICEEMPYEEAVKSGALAFFKQRYPSQVKVYKIGDYSKEICAGPHVKRTGELGHFKIIREESSAAGVRRIKAILK